MGAFIKVSWPGDSLGNSAAEPDHAALSCYNMPVHSHPPSMSHTRVPPTDTAVSKQVIPVPCSLLAHTGRGKPGEWHIDGQYITGTYHGVTVTLLRYLSETGFVLKLNADKTQRAHGWQHHPHIRPIVRWLGSRSTMHREDMGGPLQGQCSDSQGLEYPTPSHPILRQGLTTLLRSASNSPSSCLSLRTAGITDTCCHAQLSHLKYKAMDRK